MKYFSLKNKKGASVLLIAVLLIGIAGLIITFAGNYSSLQQKTSTNIYMNNQSYEAAEVGIEYALSYLQNNSSTVTGSPVSGFINYSIATTTLPNNATYAVAITNPTANNYNLLTLTATGKNADGTSTSVISQQVYKPSGSIKSLVESQGSVVMTGSAGITIPSTMSTSLMSGGTLNISNGAATYTGDSSSRTLVSTQGSIQSDIQQSVSSLGSMTESQYFSSVFGTSEASELASITAGGGHVYTNISGGNYTATLSGMSGTSVWITQNDGNPVTIGGGVTIGTPAAPVLLIVEGSLNFANGFTFYGFIYASGGASGTNNLAGGGNIYGGLANYGTLNMSNNAQVYYQALSGANYPGSGNYAKVAGSWKDF